MPKAGSALNLVWVADVARAGDVTFAFLVIAASGVDLIALCDKDHKDGLCKG